ncbi:hypothetical protein FRZ03_01070 [Streptomyces misionensis]|uniref:Tetratricopeptide repeat protein n=1 Tax=Streptomyces misionensis TaxID=67331 RepID=A0A5C6K6N5_9ACTN|nr:hypothetical protein [Streptomyces misionensis]TWV58031.1 hypothetical protein FRZ03_01070 [Streptomyces misionensis]
MKRTLAAAELGDTEALRRAGVRPAAEGRLEEALAWYGRAAEAGGRAGERVSSKRSSGANARRPTGAMRCFGGLPTG